MHAQIPRNVQTMQQNWKENGFQIFKYIINNTCFSSICYNLFWASQKYVGQVKIINNLPGVAS